MNPIRSNEDHIFRMYMYDYLKKRGLHYTAEVFRMEGQVSSKPPIEINQNRHGFLHDFWKSLHDDLYNPRLKMPPPPSNKVQNVGSKRDTTASQIYRDGYSMQLIGNFKSMNSLSSCDFSSDGKVLASGGFEKKAFICYMDTCEFINTSESHLAPITEVRFQPRTTIFATSSPDKTPRTALFDLVGHKGVVKSLDFHPNEALLCSSDSFDVIEVWDLVKCIRLKNFMAGGQKIRFQPVFGKFLAVANGNVITILDIQTWKGHSKEIRSICWDTQGQRIASVTEDCARVWSIAGRGQYLHEYKANGKRFQSIIFHPRYPNVLVIGAFQNIELWITETEQVYHIPTHTKATVTGLAACAQNQFIASCSSDRTVKIWK
ncbi:transcriptional corepressor LEUNIG-like [Vicia villosa]|uniref:transcriptional corepressor LEUNIG-like n=1 Tax=Vicia villosa TaxID=3911 RepID=UPI00273B2422|nr:transcriptional corepressor LEUNIG-like [Vicia villosa]